MIDLSLYISKLLFDHDKVIVNGFGVFTTTDKAVYHHPVSHEYTPKSKRISFVHDVKLRDTLLIDSIGLSNAEELVTEFVKEINANLDKDKSYFFENIGKIVKHSSGILLFEQDDKINYNKECYFLPIVFFGY